MKNGMELYFRTVGEDQPIRIELMVFPCRQYDGAGEIFDDAYKAFTEARRKTGGFLRIAGKKVGGTWPPVSLVSYNGRLRSGYAATIARPKKNTVECLQQLIELGYRLTQ